MYAATKKLFLPRLYGSSRNTGKVALDLLAMNGDRRVDRALKDTYSTRCAIAVIDRAEGTVQVDDYISLYANTTFSGLSLIVSYQ